MRNPNWAMRSERRSKGVLMQGTCDEAAARSSSAASHHDSPQRTWHDVPDDVRGDVRQKALHCFEVCLADPGTKLWQQNSISTSSKPEPCMDM